MADIEIANETKLKLKMTDAHIVGNVSDYGLLENKPKIGGVTIDGNQLPTYYGLADADTVDTLKGNFSSHEIDYTNPHKVTKEQVGLGNVDNTADTEKIVKQSAFSQYASEADKTLFVMASDGSGATYTVDADVPADAKFTDTTYEPISSDRINAICV